MAKEYFDLLDENGNKTGKIKLRNEVHRDGDWHKAVHIWIINENGDVLLQRRCATKDSNPNMLDISSAGHLSAGDNSVSGANSQNRTGDLRVTNPLLYLLSYIGI